MERERPLVLLRDGHARHQLARFPGRGGRRHQLPGSRPRDHCLPGAAGTVGLGLHAPPGSLGHRPAPHRLDCLDRARDGRPQLPAGAGELAAPHRTGRTDRRRLHQSCDPRHWGQSPAGDGMALCDHSHGADARAVLGFARTGGHRVAQDAGPTGQGRQGQAGRRRTGPEQHSGGRDRRLRPSRLLGQHRLPPRHRQSARQRRGAPRGRDCAMARGCRRTRNGRPRAAGTGGGTPGTAASHRAPHLRPGPARRGRRGRLRRDRR